MQQATLSVHIRKKFKGTATLVEMCGRKCIMGSNKILNREIISMEIETIEFITCTINVSNGWPLMLNTKGTTVYYTETYMYRKINYVVKTQS